MRFGRSSQPDGRQQQNGMTSVGTCCGTWQLNKPLTFPPQVHTKNQEKPLGRANLPPGPTTGGTTYLFFIVGGSGNLLEQKRQGALLAAVACALFLPIFGPAFDTNQRQRNVAKMSPKALKDGIPRPKPFLRVPSPFNTPTSNHSSMKMGIRTCQSPPEGCFPSPRTHAGTAVSPACVWYGRSWDCEPFGGLTLGCRVSRCWSCLAGAGAMTIRF